MNAIWKEIRKPKRDRRMERHIDQPLREFICAPLLERELDYGSHTRMAASVCRDYGQDFLGTGPLDPEAESICATYGL